MSKGLALEINNVEKDNDVVSRFLLEWERTNRNINRNRIISYLNDSSSWGYYLADQFLQQKEVNSEIQKQVADWFYAHLSKTNFLTAITEVPSSNGSRWHYRLLEFLIARLFQRCDFTVPEDILLDMLSFDMYGLGSGHDPNHKITLTDKILQQLGSSQQVKERVVSNLERGIISSMILQNHIALCRYLNLFEALPIIKTLLQDEHLMSSYQRQNALVTYIALGGKLNDMSFVFGQFNVADDFHWHLINEFSKQISFKKRIRELLLEKIRIGIIQSDNLTVIALLTEVGSKEGLDLLIKWIKTNNAMPDFSNSNVGVSNLQPQVVAESMIDLIRYVLTNEFTDESSNDPLSIPLSYLNSIAFEEQATYEYINAELVKLVEEYRGQKKYSIFKYYFLNLEKEYYLRKPDYTNVSEAVKAYNNG